MATKKKTVAKPAPKKSAKVAPKTLVKKAAPQKGNAKPAAKKPAPKPPAQKAVAAKPPVAKPAAKKPAAKPAPQKAASKPAPKKAVSKPVPKAPVKKVAPKAPPAKVAAKAPAKPAPKPAPKPVAKPVAKPAAKPAAKPVPAPVAKPAAKTNNVPPAAPLAKRAEPNKIKEVVLKPVVKQAIQQLKKDEKAKKPAQLKPIKTSVTTSVKYQPDFTKSILDSKQEQYQQGTLVRYTDAELQEFKELIQRKLEAAKKELTYLQGLITRKDEMGGGESEGRYMTMEDGTISMEREQLAQMASRQITYIDHLEKALMRIENKTYGICRVTGKLIDKARLRAVPHATLSIEAKMGLVKGPQPSGE